MYVIYIYIYYEKVCILENNICNVDFMLYEYAAKLYNVIWTHMLWLTVMPLLHIVHNKYKILDPPIRLKKI